MSQLKGDDYDTKIEENKNKIPCITGLVNTVALNTKGAEIKKKYQILLIQGRKLIY